MTKPRLVKYLGDVWHCRSPVYWGTGFTKEQAYACWLTYMRKHGYA